MPPPATASAPLKPPSTTAMFPLALVPATFSAAMVIVASAPGGNRIAPLVVNGPSRDPPAALEMEGPVASTIAVAGQPDLRRGED